MVMIKIHLNNIISINNLTIQIVFLFKIENNIISKNLSIIF